jgi:hypothetical protein
VLEPLGKSIHVFQREKLLNVARLGRKATEKLDSELVLQNPRDLVAGHDDGNSAFVSDHPLSQLALGMGIRSIDLV